MVRLEMGTRIGVELRMGIHRKSRLIFCAALAAWPSSKDKIRDSTTSIMMGKVIASSSLSHILHTWTFARDLRSRPETVENLASDCLNEESSVHAELRRDPASSYFAWLVMDIRWDHKLCEQKGVTHLMRALGAGGTWGGYGIGCF